MRRITAFTCLSFAAVFSSSLMRATISGSPERPAMPRFSSSEIMPEISTMSTFSFPFPITVVSLSGWTGGTRETDMKLQPEAKNRHRPKMQVEIVKKYLFFIFFMMDNCVGDVSYTVIHHEKDEKQIFFNYLYLHFRSVSIFSFRL